MANYESIVCSNKFKVKKESIENVRKALSYFEESCVDDEGNAIIASYGETLSDEIEVLMSKATGEVVGSFDYSAQMAEDLLDVNENVDDYYSKGFQEFLQENMLDGEHVFIKELGHEKFRYAISVGLLITKKLVRWIDLDVEAHEILEENEG